ncbi:hypothetical protein BC937DRAFT_87186 [Endogone sp. FLAS-F59071]|nr:hypothetical protein BC937DRAFT_87184 [Endogone sp. FLAS-F59071]RUS19626.1 hypothetical protein BC937DRAFT_87186 [Endogone sp. FLAS-F59071]|eukprot:RUS19624.1 hypothetical protein BC937DRAFT_87184 [Endogone sp. FLAS-F59071]
MEQLLQWAITNTDQDQLHANAEAVRRGEREPKPPQQTFDPELLEAILGKDDATRMKEAVVVFTNQSETLENREIALDNLELVPSFSCSSFAISRSFVNGKLTPLSLQLVEQIDNAMSTHRLPLIVISLHFPLLPIPLFNIFHFTIPTDIQNMKLWPPILSLLSSPEPSLRKGAAWVCGTAVQNNIKAQQAVGVMNVLEDWNWIQGK